MKTRNIYKWPHTFKSAHDGNGNVRISRILSSNDFVGPWNFVDFAVLKPDTSIGLHRHENNEEMYVILQGSCILTANGEQKRLSKGDIFVNPPFGTHGLINDSEDDLHLLVVEVGMEE